jgi:hypothetical protein
MFPALATLSMGASKNAGSTADLAAAAPDPVFPDGYTCAFSYFT